MKSQNGLNTNLLKIAALIAVFLYACGVNLCLIQSATAGSVKSWGSSALDSSDFPITNAVAISTWARQSLALKSDGSIVGWGDNSFGQAAPPAGNNFTAISAGLHHSLALKSDGTIVGWGRNDIGQATPPSGNSFTAISAGYQHSLALKSDGSIVGWGSNGSGQANSPTGHDFVAIAAGQQHSLALKADGSIVGWGDNGYGKATPPSGNNFVAISTCGEHSLALKSDGSIVGWGRNDLGQATPPSGNNYVAIAAGDWHGLALKSDGSIVGWGYNSYGQATPPAGNNYVAIAAGSWYSLALKSDGSIVGWGWNSFGQATPPAGNNFTAIAAGYWHSLALKSDGSIVGWGYNEYRQATPPAGNNYVAIAAGSYHSLALKSDGSIVGWGWNDYGQATPPAGNNYVAIAAGDSHSLALKSDGSIVGWGDNSFGQAAPPAGNSFTAISAGYWHSLALKSDGSIVGWGSNDSGQAAPPAGNNYVAISAGDWHSLALKSDGSIVGWGWNDYGQATPPAGNNYVAIAAGDWHSLALKSDGSIVAWGYNEYRQATPPTGNNYVAIAAGSYHSLALVFTIGGYIDWADLAVFVDRWLENTCNDANRWCGRADINHDSNVNFSDFAFLAQYWLQTAPAPNTASNPDPNDTATNISITANLSWMAGADTACHAVYFGTNSTPDANDFQGYQTATTFDPGILGGNTIYYWRIDEVGIDKTTTGDVWSFTTAPAPGQASSPSPNDMATDVNITPILTWTAGSNATSHNVYFGTDSTPDVNEFQGNQTTTTFNPSTLDYETTYYWRIDELGLGGTTEGAIWRFTIMIDPNLVGRWRFNETSGNIAYDSSGNENNGMLMDGIGNGLVWEPTEGALNFDGSNNLSRVVIPTTGMRTTAGTITIWANLAEPQIRGGGRNGQAYFFGCDNGGINKILIYMSNSDTRLDVKVGNQLASNITTLSTETLYQIGLTWNAGAYSVYVNGSPLVAGTYGGLTSLPSTADIGNNGGSHTHSLHGLVDYIMIFDKSLSATEIQQLYQDGPN